MSKLNYEVDNVITDKKIFSSVLSYNQESHNVYRKKTTLKDVTISFTRKLIKLNHLSVKR